MAMERGEERAGSAREVAEAVRANSKHRPPGKTLESWQRPSIINGHAIEASPTASIFDHAETLGVRVPTSCHKQGKCRECMVEVTEGAELLSERTEEERHLSGKFRLSCRTHVAASRREVRLPHHAARETCASKRSQRVSPRDCAGVHIDPGGGS